MTSPENLLASGIPGFDTVLNGGLSRRAVVMLIGSPGAGKTVLASSIIFHAARQGTQTVVFTSFSESNEQYIEHMSSFAFFDQSLIGGKVQLFTLASQSQDEKNSLATSIARTIRTSGAKMVLLDGFQSARTTGASAQEIQATLSALATQIRYLDVTLLITIAGNARDGSLHTEMTVADIIVGLEYRIKGRRFERLLDVVKLRGRAQRPGTHSYAITSGGAEVFPRIETIDVPSTPAKPTERVPFGLPELDALLGGGPNTGTITLLAGAPGVGKTTLALLWALNTAGPDDRTLFFTFGEYPEQLQYKANAFHLDMQGALDADRLRVVRLSSVDIDPDAVASMLLAQLNAGDVQRVVFDEMTVLLHELGDRARDYLGALNETIYRLGITSMYMLEIPPFSGFRMDLGSTPLAVLGDNVVIIQQYDIGGSLRRLMAVLRMRLSFFDRTLRELVLDEDGIRVLQPAESASGVLDEGAQISGGSAP